jgi:hypothetical protein
MRLHLAQPDRPRRFHRAALTAASAAIILTGMCAVGAVTARASTQVPAMHLFSGTHVYTHASARSAGLPAAIWQKNTGLGVTPDTGNTCTDGSSGGNVTTCMYVDGVGLSVNVMSATASVHNSARNLIVCIVPPDHSVAWCNGPALIQPHGELAQQLFPEGADVQRGDWCGYTIRVNSDTTENVIGDACVNVHP